MPSCPSLQYNNILPSGVHCNLVTVDLNPDFAIVGSENVRVPALITVKNSISPVRSLDTARIFTEGQNATAAEGCFESRIHEEQTVSYIHVPDLVVVMARYLPLA